MFIGIWFDVICGFDGFYDFIVFNLLFYQVGKVDWVDVGQGFIWVVVGGLCFGGVFYMVVNCYLFYEVMLKDVFVMVDMFVDVGGYKVIWVIKGKDIVKLRGWC